jgi:chemotaxis signal transduction protein
VVARLGDERVAIPVGDVLEVLDAPTIKPLPLMPPGVIGQVLMREQWIPVLDTQTLIGIGRTGTGPGAALVLGGARDLFALWMDDVDEVRDVAPDQECPLPPGTDRLGKKVLSALVLIDGRLLALLETNALRTAAEDTLHAGTTL